MPKAIIISRSGDYHKLTSKDVAEPDAKPEEVLLKIQAAALNHRDLYIRQNLYPAISFENPLLADGCAVIVSDSKSSTNQSNFSPSRRVIINPGTGWIADSAGPEGPYTVIGGSSMTPLGTLQEMVAVLADDVETAPEHLSDAEAAALPLTGLTAWRALVTKSGNAEPDRNILVTGIGGGVAIMTLLLATAKGCNVFVTSSSAEKIDRARGFGAKGGVVYSDEKGWPKQLQHLLPKDRPFLDAVIDGAGGDIVGKTWKLLKNGGVIVSYGMTSMGQPTLPMQAVLKNIELKGSTMGSRKEFKEMVQFVGEKKIKPIVERVVSGLDNLEGIEGLFDDLKEGKQFGKLVIEIGNGGQDKSKL